QVNKVLAGVRPVVVSCQQAPRSLECGGSTPLWIRMKQNQSKAASNRRTPKRRRRVGSSWGRGPGFRGGEVSRGLPVVMPGGGGGFRPAAEGQGEGRGAEGGRGASRQGGGVREGRQGHRRRHADRPQTGRRRPGAVGRAEGPAHARPERLDRRRRGAGARE